MIKLAATKIIGTIVLAATFAAVPALADDPGANPIGNWVCLATGSGEPTGLLTMSETAYAFTKAGTQSSIEGTYRIDRSVITLTSGALKDDFGLGHFNTRSSPVALSFDTAEGRGMICNPDIYL